MCAAAQHHLAGAEEANLQELELLGFLDLHRPGRYGDHPGLYRRSARHHR